MLVTAKGAKQCALADGSKSPILYSPEDPLTAPFGFSSWEESSRKNLELRCTKGVEDYFTQFDEWVRAYLVQNSERLFKKKLTAEQVAESYKSPLHKKGDYPALLRTKVNTSGNNAVRFWDEDGNEAAEPTSWKEIQVKPLLHVRSLWIMGPSFGFTVECTDLQVHTPRRTCPFGEPKV